MREGHSVVGLKRLEPEVLRETVASSWTGADSLFANICAAFGMKDEC